MPIQGGGGRGKSILIVEDDPDLVECLRSLLEEEGYAVAMAADGEAALAEADRARPGIALIDLHLPGALTGARLVEALREHLPPSARLLLITGERDVLRHAEEMGVDGFLEKPFAVDELLRVVEKQT